MAAEKRKDEDRASSDGEDSKFYRVDADVAESKGVVEFGSVFDGSVLTFDEEISTAGDIDKIATRYPGLNGIKCICFEYCKMDESVINALGLLISGTQVRELEFTDSFYASIECLAKALNNSQVDRLNLLKEDLTSDFCSGLVHLKQTNVNFLELDSKMDVAALEQLHNLKDTNVKRLRLSFSVLETPEALGTLKNTKLTHLDISSDIEHTKITLEKIAALADVLKDSSIQTIDLLFGEDREYLVFTNFEFLLKKNKIKPEDFYNVVIELVEKTNISKIGDVDHYNMPQGFRFRLNAALTNNACRNDGTALYLLDEGVNQGRELGDQVSEDVMKVIGRYATFRDGPKYTDKIRQEHHQRVARQSASGAAASSDAGSSRSLGI